MTEKNNKVQLGDFVVDLQQEKLFSPRVEIKLEPQTFALLRLFITNDKSIISRDEIMANIWQGRQVTDDAVRAVVKKLRQALTDDARNPKYIKTLPLKGYRLITKPEPVIDINSTSKIDIPASSGLLPKSTEFSENRVVLPTNNKIKLTRLIVMLVAVIVMIGAFIFNRLYSPKVTTPSSTNKTLLTQMAGSEVSADYSPTNNTLVFSHRNNKDEPLALFIKNLTSNRVQRLTWDEAQYANATWSADGKKILFSRSDKQGTRLFITGINNDGLIKPKPIVSEKLKGKYPLSWSVTGNAFYVKSGRNGTSVQGISLYNIEHNTLIDITSPNVSGAGDYFAKESYDGKKLAILRAVNAKKHELLILDIETQTLLINHVLPFVATKLAWHSNHQQLVLSSFKGEIGTFDIANQQLAFQALNLPFANDIFYQCGDSCYFLRQHNGNFLDIQEQPNPFYQQQLMVNDHIELISADDLPIYNAQGNTIYFVSLFENKQVIHRQKENLALENLYTLSAKDRISALSVNFDETKLLGTINQRVFIYDINTQVFKYLTSDLIHARFPTWHQNGKDVYFSINENNTNNFYYYQQATQVPTLIAKNIVAGKPISNQALIVIDNRLIAHKVMLEDLLDPIHSNTVLPNQAVGMVSTAAPNRWHIKQNYLYFSQRVGQSSELVRINLENFDMEKAFLAKNRFRLNFALHPEQHKMLVVKSLLAQSNLIKTQL